MTYKLFTLEYCRNCPEVKSYMLKTKLVGELIDVRTNYGIQGAKKYKIKSVPTVILFDDDGKIIKIIKDIDDLKKYIRIN